MKEVDWVVIGRFGRAHGIKGFITVHSFTEPRDNILNYSHWHARINNQWQAINLIQIEVTGKSILALIEGFSEREQVASLTNVDIAVSQKQLPELEPGEYYWHELIGMKVINQDGFEFGVVIEIMPTGSNDVLVIKGESRYLIPYLPGQFVEQVDRVQGVITVNWDADF